ncbi:amidohydrolase family protein [Dyadobacter psychrotolerans]|uniref:Amidohydrolase n=1 Tax=Dyadobacter psychrotolerans TaxID=2541721 RepID=A0A4R5DTM0_9BACT|nr:amidohydrolase family protein [Dyadobacter psychrotolerans]TDE15650.1 amidohydrolase [Dyadobacter psychrotolerans]
MNRRTFLSLSAGASLATGLSVSAQRKAAIPIIDTHIHLFDPNRPQGIPWPGKNDKILYKPALPERYRGIAGRLGVAGAIVVEASPWPEDNQWVLEVAAKDKIIVGVIGNLEPGKPEFNKQLDRFQNNPLFLGIRYGNLWGRDIAIQLKSPGFISDLKALARDGLVLDTANPNPALLAAIVNLTDLVPDLKIIIDHLPQMNIPADKQIKNNYEADLRLLGQSPKVYVKISEVLRRVNGQIPTELDFYRERLDELFTTFGEDRLLYGSDWPNSDQWLPFETGLNLVREYFMEKGQTAAEKYFWKNSVAAYNWRKRDVTQP